MQAQFVKAEKNVKEFNISVDLTKKESKKLLERAELAEKDMKDAGSQIQRLVKSVYKVETQAADEAAGCSMAYYLEFSFCSAQYRLANSGFRFCDFSITRQLQIRMLYVGLLAREENGGKRLLQDNTYEVEEDCAKQMDNEDFDLGAQFVKAEKNVKKFNISVDLMKKESKKLLERALLAEKDMKDAGSQIQRLVKSVYKVETQAAGSE
uniref:Uncharacterized protein n=1 Tax=Quercus lobata TaxID=97700 RepID=A0A7N2QX44_QUELO